MAEAQYLSKPNESYDLSTNPDTMQITLQWKNQQIFAMISPTKHSHQQKAEALKVLEKMMRELALNHSI